MPKVPTVSAFPIRTGTPKVILQRDSDGYRWNPTAGAWQAAPTVDNSKINMTEGSGVYADYFSTADITGLGNVGWITCVIFNDDDDTPIGIVKMYVWGGYEYTTDELSPAALTQIDDKLSTEHGDGSWLADETTGPGASENTITINNGSGGYIADADVWITSTPSFDDVVAGPKQTNSVGQVTFMLDSGVTYYIWAQKDGLNSVQGVSFVAE